ncbi:adhesion G protein-coupled receptor F5-like isoform X2 [Lissotriton helveticus]
MRFLWIVVSCPVFLLVITSPTSALEWSLESLFYPMTYIGNKIENTFSKSLSRHKRAVSALAPQEYTIDIEVSLVNASFLNALRTFLKDLPLPIEATIIGTHLNITSLEVTAVCTAKESGVNCSCESGYVWPSDVCPATPTCSGSSTTCDCLNAFPSGGCELSLPPETRKMRMKVIKEYNQNMADPSSKEYQELKKHLNDSYLVAYGALPGFQNAYVTGFRNGSIIVDYILVSGNDTDKNLTLENLKVVDYLHTQNVTVDPSGFKTIIVDKTTFTALPVIIYQGDTVNLMCETSSGSSAVTWSHNETNIAADGRKYVISSNSKDGTSESNLTISQFDFSDGGSYTCSLEDDLNIYVQSKELLVQLLKEESHDFVVCGGDKVDIFKCCTNGNITNLTANCTVGEQGFRGAINFDSTCVAYSVQPNISNCQVGSTNANYDCECHTQSGAKKELTITVTFFRKGVACNKADVGKGTKGAIAEKQESLANENCVSPAIDDIVDQFTALLQNPHFQQQIPDYLTNLSFTVVGAKEDVSSSPANFVAILGILQIISGKVSNVSEDSMKGLFILVFATLWDTKVREALLHRVSLPGWASQQTKTTALSSSRPGGSRPTLKTNIKMPTFAKPGHNLFGKKGRYSLSSAFQSTSLEGDSSYSSLE